MIQNNLKWVDKFESYINKLGFRSPERFRIFATCIPKTF